MKILISDPFAPSLPDSLKQFGEVTEDRSQLTEADIVLVRSKTKCTKEYMDKAQNLKLIIRGGVGLDNIDLSYAKEKGIEVRNTPEASSVAVAELTLAHMLAASCNLIEAHNSLIKGEWKKKELKRTELMGKTLGIIGIGRVGTEVAKRAKAFGMKIIAYDKYVNQSDVAEMKPLDELLSEADYISIHVYLNDETEGMFNQEMISKMKDGVIIINTSRGKCVIEKDIAQALKNGKIRKYANDVWYSDPPDSDSPLLAASKVQFTPHLGASTKENLLRISDIIVKIISEFK